MVKAFLVFIMSMILTFCFAQPPAKFNYQAIARNANGTVVLNQVVGVRFTIIDLAINGVEIYKETHQVITNGFGLFTVTIGNGSINLGNFSNIPWDIGDKFLKVEMDITGGNNYTELGTTQLLSVPYALYSKTSGSSSLIYTGRGF